MNTISERRKAHVENHIFFLTWEYFQSSIRGRGCSTCRKQQFYQTEKCEIEAANMADNEEEKSQKGILRTKSQNLHVNPPHLFG